MPTTNETAPSFHLSELHLYNWGAFAGRHQALLDADNTAIIGPTGSGKTSTMYTMIHQLNSEQVNLLTLEDPVEYNIDGINQVQINEKTGMTFAGGLRSILRQDPDIIAVGEIRDGEAAEIAMRAAITGHLVLSTVHTNDALSTAAEGHRCAQLSHRRGPERDHLPAPGAGDLPRLQAEL